MSVIKWPKIGISLGTSPRRREIDVGAVLEGASTWVGELDQMIVLGVTKGGELYAASTHPDVADNLLLIERFRRKLMRTFGDDEFAEAPDGAA